MKARKRHRGPRKRQCHRNRAALHIPSPISFIPNPSNTKFVDPRCSSALTYPTLTCPRSNPRNSLQPPCCIAGYQRSAANSALCLLGQISAYPARAWIRCVITGRSVWSRTMSQCASAPRLVHRRPIRCAGPTATRTAVPATCEP